MMTVPLRIVQINAQDMVYVPWNFLKVDVSVIPNGQVRIVPALLVSTIVPILGVTAQTVSVCVAIS